MANVSSLVTSNGGYETAVAIPAGATSQAAAIALPAVGSAAQLPGFLPGAVNILTTVPATTGLVLPVTSQPGVVITVVNTIATATSVFPPLGGKIAAAGSAGTVNAAVALAISGIAVFISCGVQANGAGLAGVDFVRII